MESLGAAALPVILGLMLLFGYLNGGEVFSAFTIGAKEGITASMQVLPTLIGLITAVTMLRVSGLLDFLCELLRPLCQQLGISPQLAPLMLLRPVSGSGTTAYTVSLLRQFGADSEPGTIASVLSASTETTFYVISVYFGAIGQKHLRHAVPAALLGDFAAVCLSVLAVKTLS